MGTEQDMLLSEEERARLDERVAWLKRQAEVEAEAAALAKQMRQLAEKMAGPKKAAWLAAW